MRKLVTLIIDYDESKVDHPSEWMWDTLVGDENVTVKRVEVYDAGKG